MRKLAFFAAVLDPIAETVEAGAGMPIVPRLRRSAAHVGDESCPRVEI
jgi:hypothetical protein